MLIKLRITGTIEAVTGLHIGGSASFAAIGAVDAPVIRDAETDAPMIPGSSIKGKMRSLLSRQYSDSIMPVDITQDDPRVKRLFGCTSGKGKDQEAHPSRLQFSDMFLCNKQELQEMEVSATEVKFENTINRLSAIANPRQIERAVRGSKYALNLVYNMEETSEVKEDFELIRDGFKLLQYDYIGGHGSRGYGRIKLEGLKVECVVGECEKALFETITNTIKEAEA